MSGIISAPQFFRVFPDLNPVNVGPTHASTMQAFYTAIYEIGCLSGAIFALFFGNKLGRRRNIMIGIYFYFKFIQYVNCNQARLLLLLVPLSK
jgi:MFS family permease